MTSLSYKPIAVVGAGGHARAIIALLKNANQQVTGVYDDNYNPARREIILGVELIGKLVDIPTECEIVLAIGGSKYREELYHQFAKQVKEQTVIHSTAFCDPSVVLGKANIVLGNAFLNSDVVVGDNNIINTASVIEHECTVGSHNHISVGAMVCGRVNIGNNNFIGANSVIIDKVSIGDNITIGAGSVVIKDILDAGTYVGNPVRKIK